MGDGNVADLERFTHVDPFEDTERLYNRSIPTREVIKVSPTSIRSRILKGAHLDCHG